MLRNPLDDFLVYPEDKPVLTNHVRVTPIPAVTGGGDKKPELINHVRIIPKAPQQAEEKPELPPLINHVRIIPKL